MMKTLIITIVLLLLAVMAMGVKVWCVKGGKFPSGHVHDLPQLRKKGVKCGREQ